MTKEDEKTNDFVTMLFMNLPTFVIIYIVFNKDKRELNECN